MAFLYVDRLGKTKTTHSYSSGAVFHDCKRKYKLSRKDGYRQIARSAALEFGICVEDAIKEYHVCRKVKHSGTSAFMRSWEVRKNLPLKYGKTERSWKNLLAIGLAMLAEYELMIERNLLPWADKPVKWQLNYRKEVCPDSYLAGIEYTAFIDLYFELEPGRPMIVDIKTAAKALNGKVKGIVALDPQLRSYAWVTGVPDVAFLNLVKNEEPEIQFLAATISAEDIDETGLVIANEIAEIVRSEEQGFWPKEPGIRFPNNRCSFCEMRGNCLNDKELRDSLVQIENRDWIDDLEEVA